MRAGPERTTPPPADTVPLDFKRIVKHVFRYGFVETADDILFALLVGVALGGVLYLVIPSDLVANEYARWLSYPLMALVGVPLYICASASTPIAAALVAKGFSPGAALIFLMTGPATNTGTIVIIVSQFGARFASIYVGIAVAVTTALGVLIDVLLIAGGWTLSVNLEASDSPAIQFLQWSGAFALLVLIVWRFRAGALKSGYVELLANLRSLSDPWKRAWRSMTRGRSVVGMISPAAPMGRTLWGLLAALFLASGFTVVPPGSVGYGRLFGKVVLEGLTARTPLPRAPAIRENRQMAGPGSQVIDEHRFVRVPRGRPESPGALVQPPIPGEGSLYLSLAGRRTRNRRSRQASGNICASSYPPTAWSRMLNVLRVDLEREISALFTSAATRLNPVLSGVELIRANLLAIHPVNETMNAFREISSSQEARERIIVNGQRLLVNLIPQAHGNAAYEVEHARGEAFRKVTTSGAEPGAIRVVSKAVRGAPEVLQNMLMAGKVGNRAVRQRQGHRPQQAEPREGRAVEEVDG